MDKLNPFQATIRSDRKKKIVKDKKKNSELKTEDPLEMDIY